ncbi:hypothetical protein HDU67_000181 [Dinochytrium kinnereticum]|nr:hypothetical protein HDU67_000181 [Dinochytrium kinnereticum]
MFNLSKSAPANGLQSQQQFQKLQQQKMQMQLQHMNSMNSNQHMDTTLLDFSSPMIKQELELDPTDPFSMSADFGDLAGMLGGGVGASLGDLHGHHRRLPQFQDPSSMLSPLSTSPLDHDFDPIDDFTNHSASSFSDSSYGNPNAFQTPTPGTSAPLKPTTLSSQQRKLGVHPKAVDSTNVVAAAAAAAAAAASSVHHNQSNPNPSFIHAAQLQSQHHIGSYNSNTNPSGHAPGAFFSMSLPVHSNSGFGAMDHVTAAAAAAVIASKSAGSSLSSNSSAPTLTGAMGHSSAAAAAAAVAHLSTSASSTSSFKKIAGSPSSSSIKGATPSSVSSSSGTRTKDGTPFSSIDDADARSVELLNEKRRRRRESHNAVERRRRDNINEKIQELSTLLPDFTSEAQNKGAILRRSVEYIKMMQALAGRQQERMRELENCVRGLLLQSGATEQDLMLTVPLGTVFELPQMPASFGRDVDMC